MSSPFRVLIADDTITYRMVLREVVKSMSPQYEIDSVSNGQLALDKLAEQPFDVVLLDVQMPVLDGVETLKAIKAQYPNVGVIMVSSVDKNSSDITIKALQLGALDFISKPDSGSPQENMALLKGSLTPLFEAIQSSRPVSKASVPPATMSQNQPRPSIQAPPSVAPIRLAPTQSSPPSTMTMVTSGAKPAAGINMIKQPPAGCRVLVIGVSTGGPKALTEVIPRLPANLSVPVLIVQHMPPMFTASLAESLNAKSALTVKEAVQGELVQAGKAYIAPGGIHMEVQQSDGGSVCIHLSDGPPENSCKPAVDVLFRSVSAVYKNNILAAVMTGMGSDGALGVQYLKQHGQCYCVSQTEDTCVVYGMPRAVDQMGLTDAHVPLEEMAAVLTRCVSPALSIR